ncbi:hypothetical protein BGX31_001453 [Mortierella sp. GBA43]|nr:hypothetical protein BGX31_001453 [Mortierella sp. GBA43]
MRTPSAQSTFAIPQEILDPSYKSPTFRIKSWNPPAGLVPLTADTTPAPTPGNNASESLGSKETSHLNDGKQPFEGWTLSQQQGESVEKSSLWTASDQQEVAIPQAGQQGNTREQGSMRRIPPSSTPLQFSFTSDRFRAVVEASLKKATAPSTAERTVDQIDRKTEVQPPVEARVQQTVVCPELRVNELLMEDKSALNDHVQGGQVSDQSSTKIPSADHGDVTIVADALASMLSKAILPHSSSPTIHDTNHPIDSSDKDIQKSAPMSPQTPGDSSDIAATDNCPAAVLCISPSPSPSSSSSIAGSPTSPLRHEAVGIEGSGGGSGVVIEANKAVGWTSLQRLMRKMTKNNGSTLSRSGRMHLEGS